MIRKLFENTDIDRTPVRAPVIISSVRRPCSQSTVQLIEKNKQLFSATCLKWSSQETGTAIGHPRYPILLLFFHFLIISYLIHSVSQQIYYFFSIGCTSTSPTPSGKPGSTAKLGSIFYTAATERVVAVCSVSFGQDAGYCFGFSSVSYTIWSLNQIFK